MPFLMLLGIVILGCLFPAYLIDAIRAADEKTAHDKRNYACVTFGALVLLMTLFLTG